MTRVEVKGRDAAQEAYRVATQDGYALLPEHLMQNALRPGLRPTHQEAYEWIAQNRRAIGQAVARLAQGKPARHPFDTLTLIETPPASSLSKYSGECEGPAPHTDSHNRS